MSNKAKLILSLLALAFLALLWSELTKADRNRRAMREAPKITVIDGCQYLEMETHYNHLVWSHKGNCTNSIHSQ